MFLTSFHDLNYGLGHYKVNQPIEEEGQKSVSRQDSYSSWKKSALPSTIAVVLVGLGLGVAFSKQVSILPDSAAIASIALGLAWAWILIQLIDTLRQALAFRGDPIPVSFQGAHPEQTDAQRQGSGRITSRATNLVSAWKEGGSAEQVLSLAQFQSQQSRNGAQAGLVFGLVLLATGGWQGADASLTVIGLIVLAAAYVARQTVDRQTDHYLETRLLSKLSGSASADGGSSETLAASIGQAVNSGFDQIATSLQGPVETMSRETVAQMENVGRALGAGYEKMEAALRQHAGTIDQTGGAWSSSMQGVLDGHASKLVAASDTIATQLSKITEMQQNIEQVLRLQEGINSTLSSVTSAEEFKETFNALRRHLDDSDALLREIGKPRTIRLVEEEQE